MVALAEVPVGHVEDSPPEERAVREEADGFAGEREVHAAWIIRTWGERWAPGLDARGSGRCAGPGTSSGAGRGAPRRNRGAGREA